MITVSYFPFVGALSGADAISVDSLSAVSFTISDGKTGVIFMVTGDVGCWFSDSTVDPENKRGLPLDPRTPLQWDKVKPGFKIYFKCLSGESTTVSLVEY